MPRRSPEPTGSRSMTPGLPLRRPHPAAASARSPTTNTSAGRITPTGTTITTGPTLRNGGHARENPDTLAACHAAGFLGAAVAGANGAVLRRRPPAPPGGHGFAAGPAP